MFHHILIATDGSELANRAVKQGLEFARGIGARVTALNVTEAWSPLEMATKARQAEKHPTEEYDAAAALSAMNILAGVSEAAGKLGVECDVVHIADTKPAEGIVGAAKKHGCDLIVMSSHGRNGFKALVLGSQAMEVISATKSPVLICR